MDYEKKYKEALEKGREFYAKLANRQLKEEVEEIFPEIRGSEDEKIRKEIIEYIKIGTYHKDWIAWLEKQGIQKSKKVSLWKHWKDGIAGNSEGKLIYLVKMDNTYRLTSCLGFECDYIELTELDKLLSEKQGEQKPNPCENCGIVDKVKPKFKAGDRVIGIVSGMQYYITEVCDDYYYTESGCAIMFCSQDNFELYKQKPAAWSEEDEEIISQLAAICHVAAHASCAKFIDWLKSLKDRVFPQPKQEWNEEDEAFYQRLEQIVCKVDIEAFQGDRDLHSWLRSLRPPYYCDSCKLKKSIEGWKPSDKQMEALDNALSLAKNCGEENAFDLRTLYEQLKKLKD